MPIQHTNKLGLVYRNIDTGQCQYCPSASLNKDQRYNRLVITLARRMLFLTDSKFWVGFHAALGHINTLVFFFLANTNGHGHFEGTPDNQAGNEYPHEDGQRTNQLTN